MPKKEIENKKTILIIEDDVTLTKAIGKFLRQNGFNVLDAYDAFNGLKVFEKEKPDLILTDLSLPDVFGLTVIQEIFKIDANIPVIIISGTATIEIVVESLKYGSLCFIQKPFNPHEVLEKVKMVFENPKELKIKYQTDLINYLIEIINRHQFSKKDTESGGKSDNYKDICASVAHSLNGEFLHIGMANKQIREAENNLNDIREACDIIDRSVAFSNIFLQNLLDYIKMGILKVGPIDSRELVKRTELLARPRMLSNIDFQVNINQIIKNPIVLGNFEQLMGILLELINNAKNALCIDGGTIVLSLEEKNNEMVITLSDNGKGIPENIQGQLFNQQVPSQKGLGIGIYLSNKVIHQMGGNLILNNSSEKGTIFSVILPIASGKNDKKDG